MKVKFLRTVIAQFGTFEIGTVHDLTEGQFEYLSALIADELELVVDDPHDD